MTLAPIWTDRALAVLRLVSAFCLIQHATAKLFGFPHVAYFDNLQVLSLIGVAGIIELIGSLMLLAGFQTRLAALYGAEGALSLEPNEHGGVTASLELPLRLEPLETCDAGAAV